MGILSNCISYGLFSLIYTKCLCLNINVLASSIAGFVGILCGYGHPPRDYFAYYIYIIIML